MRLKRVLISSPYSIRCIWWWSANFSQSDCFNQRTFCLNYSCRVLNPRKEESGVRRPSTMYQSASVAVGRLGDCLGGWSYKQCGSAYHRSNDRDGNFDKSCPTYREGSTISFRLDPRSAGSLSASADDNPSVQLFSNMLWSRFGGRQTRVLCLQYASSLLEEFAFLDLSKFCRHNIRSIDYPNP
jgi:hypothetical protein